MSRVELRSVRKNFGSLAIIPELNLEINSGEFIALVGPSGCGKSTILRMVAGLETPSSGEIRIGDRVVNDVDPKSRGVAMVFQSYALYPHMTVRQNLAFGLRMARTDPRETERRIDETAEILGLKELLERKPSQLSGGQKQRVAMGRAMIRRPQVLLFDEPLSNLDAQLRIKVRAEIALLHERLKATIIYVTHDQVEAMTLADRIAVLNRGNLEQCGSPMEVYRKPKSRFVASFIGTPPMNFVSARKVPSKLSSPWAELVGFRPESTRLRQGGEGAVKIAQGRVSLIEPLGSTSYVHLLVDETTVISEVRGDELPQPGESLEVWVDPKDLFHFASDGSLLP